MTRVKRGFVARHRRKKVLRRARGFRGSMGRLFRPAHQAVTDAMVYATRDRKARKRDFRRLWITRIGVAAKQFGLSYNRFIAGLKKAKVLLDRKSLADLAARDIPAFETLVKIARGEKV
jgi:large subunit ribosomal protein L20